MATSKYLFGLQDGHFIEAVLIPDPPRCTLCISSQVGCPFKCRFCLTGALGIQAQFRHGRNCGSGLPGAKTIKEPAGESPILSSWEWGNRLPTTNRFCKAIRIMVDPNGLAFSHRRITLSTAGLVPQLRRLGKDSPVNLAISLHAPDDALRNELMPINRTYPLAELLVGLPRISSCSQKTDYL